MAEELGLDPAEVHKPQFAEIFTGNLPIPSSSTQTYAMRYGGHQFGSWAGMHTLHVHMLLPFQIQKWSVTYAQLPFCYAWQTHVSRCNSL